MSIIEYRGPSNPQDIRRYLERRTKDVIIGKYLELWREYGKLEEREQALEAENAAMDQERSRYRVKAMKLAVENRQLKSRSAWLDGERDALIDQKNALAAHVERGKAIMAKLCENDFNNRRADQELFGWYTDAPTTSLARLKAEWQAEALEEALRRMRGTCYGEIRVEEYLEELCRQAGGGE